MTFPNILASASSRSDSRAKPPASSGALRTQRASLAYGNKMYITFPAKVMHLFDPATERSLIDG